MDKLEKLLPTLKFPKNRGHGGSRMNKDQKTPQVLFFGMQKHYGKYMLGYGSRYYPEVERLLTDIVNEAFSDFFYTNVQINKNVKTDRHLDKKNIGDSCTFCVGDYTGGRLGTDGGYTNLYKRVFMFNGSKVEHWTEPFEGERYCIIYYTHNVTPNPKVSLAIDILKPERQTDYLTIDEIFRKDIYNMKQYIEPGETWIDIGGNIGAFALQAKRLGAEKIHCYEPCNRNYQRLERIQDDVIQIHNCAVSDYTGEADLYLDRNGDWRHTIVREIHGRDREKVNVIDAIDLPECNGIKLDCEGSEVSIIERLLKNKKIPQKLILEYDGEHRPSLKDYLAFIVFLKGYYSEVIYPELDKDFNFFPNGVTIWAKTSPPA